MNLDKQQFKTEVNGKTLTLEVSKLAEQANAAVLGTYGNTSVLVTAVMGKEERNIGYFPLTIDYEERFYAAGKIIGSRFIRREGRPSENAVLSGRLIDRTFRPLFDKKMRHDVQIVITVLAYDEENDPDFVSLISASTALLISEIPWDGPVAGLKMAKINSPSGESELLINPANSELAEKQISFESFVCGPENRINMIELSGDDAKEEEVLGAFEKSQIEINKLIAFQKEIQAKIGKKKLEIVSKEMAPEVENKINDFLKGKLDGAVYTESKSDRNENISALKKDLFEYLKNEEVEDISGVEDVFEKELNKLVHKNILESGKRPDGRKIDEIRPLYAEIGLFDRLHGSSLFMRGSTQALAVVTLGAPGAAQMVETIEFSGKRRFMLHYNFPPYSVGETGRIGPTNRREIGHGALAEKAVKPMIPPQEEFPYTIRIVSEILSSNGSSSMATVCASTLALMDAGVPVKKPVAGISMGIVVDENKYKIFTDIQGLEDFYGDMDFKVAGTKDGITAIQTDVKIKGLTIEMMKEILAGAKKGRLEILDFMKGIIEKPRPELSRFAPIIMTLNIAPAQIGEVIGPGGKIINKIIEETGVESIDIEDDGMVFVTAIGKEKAAAAVNYIKSITREFQIGEVIEGNIIKILDFGAIVDLGGGKDGMIHVSELKNGFVEKVEDVVKLGNFVRAKIIKVEGGKIGLSLKAIKE